MAPVALVAISVVIALIVRSQLHHVHHATRSTPQQTTGQLVHRGRVGHKTHKPKFYIVRSGDTLSAISVKTGVPIATLQVLNPNLDPNALQTGQRIRLRR